jgi:KAP family P-loop domain
MNLHRHASRQDRPIDSEAADQLDRGPFVDSLVRALIVDELTDKGELVGRQATGYVVGLTGRWGLGKSSVLNLLARKLGPMEHVIVALFNPWLFKGRDELVAGFFNALRSAMGRSSTEAARGLVEFIERYWGAINLAGQGVAAVVDLHGGLGTATAGWKKWAPRWRGALPKSKTPTPDEERHSLERKIMNAKCAVVVLIDELDRVEDDEVRAVAQLVKAVGDIKGVSYLVAYDPDRVVQALGRGVGDERRTSGELYLEKIIQHPVPLRPLFTEDAKALFDAAIADHEVDLETPRTDGQRAILDHLTEAIQTPREIKRLVGAFSVLERAVRGEICPYDALGYCWILTKSPAVRDQIAAHIDDLVSDPSEKAMIENAVRRMDKEEEPDLVTVLGAAADAQKKTLELLFPRFTKASGADDGDRLSRRRNLLRMLYLGNPPGMMRRAELEELWSSSGLAKLEGALRHLMSEGKLAATLDRLDDLLPSLPDVGDRTFWVALSRVFCRRSDWLSGPEAARALAVDTATTLYRLVLRDPKRAPRLSSAIDGLIAANDLVLVPWIIRKHLFVHGLTIPPQSPRGGGVLNVQETKDLLARELPRYRRAVLDGTALRRLPNLEAVYVIANSGHWDTDMRKFFTAQLNSLEAISTFAGLLVPPGYIANRASLEQLFDATEVETRIERLFADAKMPADPWLAESLQRLRRILAGQDPNFDLGD